MSDRDVNLDTNAEVSREYELVIMGAGLAGLMLARQLKLQIPDLEIAIVDKKTQFDSWVGESTLAPWEDYARRVLKIERYIEVNCIEKHGLRFFWDSKDKDLAMSELSEEGRSWKFPLFPSRQLDRAKFDSDLCDMVREQGVDVYLGTRVLGRGNEWSDTVQINGKDGHLVHTDKGIFRCKWLVDGTGRQSPISRIYDLVSSDPRHNVASYWGRFEGCHSIDDLGEGEWKERMQGVSRFPSTNHFMYHGYWIWLIPVDHKVDSIGVTFKRDFDDTKLRNERELVDFLKQHRCMRDLLGDNFKVHDFYALANIARGAKQHFSTDRWFLTGMSGWVIDPLFSVTCRIIAMNNLFIGHMIQADRSGRQAHFEGMVKHFNLAMRSAYEEVLEAVRHYDFHASYDIFHRWYFAMLANAYSNFLPKVTTQFEDLSNTALEHGTGCDCAEVMAQKKSFNRVLGGIGDELMTLLNRHGKFYENNRGKWADTGDEMGPAARPGMWDAMKGRPSENNVERERQETYARTFRSFLKRAAELEGLSPSDDAIEAQIHHWEEERSLLEALDALR